MRRLPAILVIIIFVALIVSFFIPAVVENSIFIGSTHQNVASSLIQPGKWTQWDSGVREAWQKDSFSCSFHQDSVRHLLTIEIPGKKILVTQISNLLYQLEEIKTNGSSSVFGLAIVPYAGNGQQRSEHTSNVVYSQKTNLFYKLFPFLKKESPAKRTISDLRSFLENNAR